MERVAAMAARSFAHRNMAKPISVILQGQQIVGSYTDYDTAVKEFRAMSPTVGDLSLHVLNRPDRQKGKALVVKNVQPTPEPPPKKNREKLL
jgi:hypothetical protein